MYYRNGKKNIKQATSVACQFQFAFYLERDIFSVFSGDEKSAINFS